MDGLRNADRQPSVKCMFCIMSLNRVKTSSVLLITVAALCWQPGLPSASAVILGDGHPIREHEKLRKTGATEYKKIVTLASDGLAPESSCWKRALTFFHDMTESCDMMQETTKSIIALTLTKCHYSVRPGSFPSAETGCDLDSLSIKCGTKISGNKPGEERHKYQNNNETRNDSGGDVDDEKGKERKDAEAEECNFKRASVVYMCKSKMSESSFSVFIQFLNHVDSICFYVQSSLWQERTENTISRLSSTANDVVLQLEQAKHEQVKLNIEAQSEREKMKSFFDEIFSLVYRMQGFQKMLSAQLTDFGTAFTYSVLIVVTYYLTGTKATQRCRLTIYLIWSLMLFVEVLAYRAYLYAKTSHISHHLSTPLHSSLSDLLQHQPNLLGQQQIILNNLSIRAKISNAILKVLSVIWYRYSSWLMSAIQQISDDSLQSAIRYWRAACISWASAIYVSAWWSFKDPTVACLEAVEAVRCGLEEVKRMTSANQIKNNKQLSANGSSSHSPVRRRDGILSPLWNIFGNSVDKDSDDPDYNSDDDTESESGFSFSSHNGLVHRAIISSVVGVPKARRGYSRASVPPQLAGSLIDSQSRPPAHPAPNFVYSGEVRRNPDRRARPKSFKSPRTVKEMEATKFNPILCRESPEMFAKELELRRLRTVIERLAVTSRESDEEHQTRREDESESCATSDDSEDASGSNTPSSDGSECENRSRNNIVRPSNSSNSGASSQILGTQPHTPPSVVWKSPLRQRRGATVEVDTVASDTTKWPLAGRRVGTPKQRPSSRPSSSRTPRCTQRFV